MNCALFQLIHYSSLPFLSHCYDFNLINICPYYKHVVYPRDCYLKILTDDVIGHNINISKYNLSADSKYIKLTTDLAIEEKF